MNRPMSIQIPTAIVLFLGITAPSMVTAESPYLLLKFTESYRDISVIGRRFATFRELNGMNTCKINYWPHRTDETNAARIGAILSDALEKETPTSTDGLRWQKPKTEIIFSAPMASIQWITTPAGPGYPTMGTDFAIVTDFAGWKLVSPSKSEIEMSETLQHLVTNRWQSKLDAYFGWNGFTNSPTLHEGMKLDDALKILGPPTHHLRNGRYVEGGPEYPFKGWLRWYHNPRQSHVAPFIELRIENGVVKDVRAGRG